jgi:integrase
VDGAAKALARFETFTKYRDFRAFHLEQAVAFKRHLAEQTSISTGKALSKATLYSTLNALKAFFQWAAGQSGFRSRLAYSDADYFNLSERDARIAKAPADKPAPSLEQARHVVLSMPAGNAIQLRDRAVVAFILLTGARDGAVVSLKIKHLDLAEGRVRQDAREVATKFGKTFDTWFFPVGDDIRRIVEEWAAYLKVQEFCGPDDPLFPTTRMVLGNAHRFHPVGLDRQHWSSAGPIREIFRRAFAAAGLPYFSPHRLRDTLTALGEQRCRSPEEFKAWSQNLGHNQVLTTFTSYGVVPADRQAAIVRGLVDNDRFREKVVEEVAAVLAKYRVQSQS